MKKYLFGLMGLCVLFNANAQGIILSQTSVVEDEESLVAPKTTNTYPGARSNSYVSEQIRPVTQSSLSNDTSDPLFLIGDDKFLSDTYLFSSDEKLLMGQYIGYGINNDLEFHVNLHYQLDFSGKDEHGFSSTEIGGVYRIGSGDSTTNIISDVLFGLRLGGSSHVRTPEYAESSYYAGLRFGRQRAGVTLAGTVKSTWVFDDERGLSYIDFMPEAYFRFVHDWRGGIGLDFRKSTNTRLLENQEWLNLKLLRQFGNTQYVGKFNYEFESHEIEFGADIKILF